MSDERIDLEQEQAVDLPNREAMSVMGASAFVPPTFMPSPEPPVQPIDSQPIPVDPPVATDPPPAA